MTSPEARQRARTLNGQIASGIDPIAQAKEARRAAEDAIRSDAVVADLWARYALEIVSGNKATTAKQKHRMWVRCIEPAIGKLKVKDITDREVGDIVRKPLTVKDGHVVDGRAEAGNYTGFFIICSTWLCCGVSGRWHWVIPLTL